MRKLGKNELGRACSLNDEVADARPDEVMEELAGAFGVDLGGLTYVAEQRALRVIMKRKGLLPVGQTPPTSPALMVGGMMVVSLTEEEGRELAAIASVWIDGVMAALRAVRDRDGTVQ